MLFEGIKPQGAAKKGHCINAECFEAKRAAWDEVLAGRKKERETAQKNAVAKARKAGLEICAACGKVIPDGEAVEAVGQKFCPKCAAKAKKRGGQGGGGGRGESWKVREKRIKAARLAFPSTPEQHLAVALHKHGVTLAEAIGAVIAGGKIGAVGDCMNVAEMLIWAQGLCTECDAVMLPYRNRPSLDDVLGAGICDADLAAWWNAAIGTVLSSEPRLNYNGENLNVPLPAAMIAAICDLERLAAACGLAVPGRPGAEVA
jgi:hypothetical protein